MISLLILAAGTGRCKEDPGLEEMQFVCDGSHACAAGWECIGGLCEPVWDGPDARIVAQPVGPPSKFKTLDPFLGCVSFRTCYRFPGEQHWRGCLKNAFAKGGTEPGLDLLVPHGVPVSMAGECLPEQSGEPVSTGRTCAAELEADEELQFYMLPRLSFGPTVDREDREQTGMTMPRYGAAVVTLQDGRVLIAGGQTDETGAVTATAEIYHPGMGAFSVVTGANGQLSQARAFAQAVLLPNGQAAIFGGRDEEGAPVAAVDIFDPGSGEFRAGKPMLHSRARHTATRLPGTGEILLAGGRGTGAGEWELWTVNEGTTVTGPLQESRWNHTATAVNFEEDATGRNLVVIAGGESDDGGGTVRDTMELFDVDAGQVADMAAPLCAASFDMGASPRAKTMHATALVSPHLYIVGGFSDRAHASPGKDVCVWHTENEGWMVLAGHMAMQHARGSFTATVFDLSSGTRVLFLGGVTESDGSLAPPLTVEAAYQTLTAEGEFELDIETLSSSMLVPRWGHAAVPTCDGRILIVGGMTGETWDSGKVTASAELFNP